MGAHLADQLDHMELIAGDGRVVQPAEVADRGDGAAQVVVLFDGTAQGLFGGVDAVDLVELVQHLFPELGLVVVQAGIVALHGRVDDGDEEALILHRLQQEEVLLHPLHSGAALGAEQCAQVVVAPLDGTLQDAADIGAVAVGHVVGRHVRRGAVGGTQAGGKAARQVQQYLRDVVAVIAQGHLSLSRGLLHQLVVGLLQQFLEPDEMLQIFHRRFSFSPPPHRAAFSV